MNGVAWLVSVFAFAVSMSATPGPNNTMLTASGAAWGLRRSVPHIAGVSVGFPAMLLAVAFGAGAVLRSEPWLQEVLRWLGAAYLLWLAWHIAAAPTSKEGSSVGNRPLSFGQAALFQWVNPKAWVIAVGGVVTYTTGSGTALLGQAAALSAVFLVTTVACTAGWTLIGVGAARILRSPVALRRFNLVLAGLLVASLLPLLAGE